MDAEATRRAIAAAAISIALAGAAGCARPAGPPPIVPGTRCVACGMAIEDLRFACERPDQDGWRAYDSIECLIRDTPPGRPAWIADYDTRTLAAAESLWVVQGEFPSPMGGGYAAFRDRAAADDVARRTRGQVGRLAAFMTRPAGERR